MIIIVGPRGAGKTTKLIDLASKCGYVIICSNPVYVYQMAAHRGKEIEVPLSYSEFIQQKWAGRVISGFLIDGLEELLLTLARGNPTGGWTMGGDHQGLSLYPNPKQKCLMASLSPEKEKT